MLLNGTGRMCPPRAACQAISSIVTICLVKKIEKKKPKKKSNCSFLSFVDWGVQCGITNETCTRVTSPPRITFNWELTLNESVLALPPRERRHPHATLVHTPAYEHELPGCRDDRNGTVFCQWASSLFECISSFPSLPNRDMHHNCAMVRGSLVLSSRYSLVSAQILGRVDTRSTSNERVTDLGGMDIGFAEAVFAEELFVIATTTIDSYMHVEAFDEETQTFETVYSGIGLNGTIVRGLPCKQRKVVLTSPNSRQLSCAYHFRRTCWCAGFAFQENGASPPSTR